MKIIDNPKDQVVQNPKNPSHLFSDQVRFRLLVEANVIVVKTVVIISSDKIK